MIAYISGTILTYTKDGAVILSGSLGYEVMGMWLGRLPLGSPVEAWIYEYLENQSIPRMVGCQSLASRNLLLQLLSVSGVGPKMAGRIVDTFAADKLVNAISHGDVTLLSTVKGLGKKTAQKIVLELGKILVTDVSSAHADIVEALSSLKFTPREIELAIEQTNLEGMNENDRLAAVLRTLGGAK